MYPPPQLPLDLSILTLNCAEKKGKRTKERRKKHRIKE